jgi:zinc transport system ATP-binding protein
MEIGDDLIEQLRRDHARLAGDDGHGLHIRFQLALAIAPRYHAHRFSKSASAFNWGHSGSIVHITENIENGDALIEVRGLFVRLGEVDILQGVDLKVARGEIVTVVGPNGAGKTTLLRAVLGLISPTAGEITRKADLRIGYMPQKPLIDTRLPMNVLRFLALGKGIAEEHIWLALAETGAEKLAERALHALSGGEMQRVLLARALLRQPELLVLDEPVRGVDVGGQADLYDLIDRLRKSHACGVLMVSHDLHVVMAATDQVVCLNRHVCCAGHPEAVSRHPEYVALFGEPAKSFAVYAHHHDHRHDG